MQADSIASMRTGLFRMTCFGAPVPQPRQKHRAVQMKGGNLTSVNYTERKHPVQQFKADLKEAAVAAGLPEQLCDGPLILDVAFYLPRPKKLMRKRDPAGPIPHADKPDLDNLLKAVKDALKGVLWRDDCQIYKYGPSTIKLYAEKAGRPRVDLVLYRPAVTPLQDAFMARIGGA